MDCSCRPLCVLLKYFFRWRLDGAWRLGRYSVKDTRDQNNTYDWKRSIVNIHAQIDDV